MRAQRLFSAVAVRSIFQSRLILLIAFAFAVMGDPVSSVAYAIEAALRALHGDLGLLVPMMGLVLASRGSLADTQVPAVRGSCL